MLRACDEVCGETGRRSKRKTWWWIEDMKEVILQKVMCSTEQNKNRCKSVMNIVRIVVLKTTSEKN